MVVVLHIQEQWHDNGKRTTWNHFEDVFPIQNGEFPLPPCYFILESNEFYRFPCSGDEWIWRFVTSRNVHIYVKYASWFFHLRVPKTQQKVCLLSCLYKGVLWMLMKIGQIFKIFLWCALCVMIPVACRKQTRSSRSPVAPTFIAVPPTLHTSGFRPKSQHHPMQACQHYHTWPRHAM